MPWYNTQALAKGIEALNRMYNSLEHDSPLKMFLNQHCSHLLKLLEGDTGISVNYADPKYLASLPQSLDLDTSYNPQQFHSLPSVVAVYTFFLDDANPVTQCGSSIRVPGRMFNHYLDSTKRVFIFKDVTISEYKWIAIKHTQNYVALYNMVNDMNAEEEYILTSFMQQEVRSLEQAYSTYAKPTNYKGIHVNTWHNSWTPGTQGTANLAKRVTWLDEQGTSFSRSSIKAAATELGYDPKQVKNVAKLGNMLDTDKYGKVTVLIEGVDKVNVPMDKRYGTSVNTIVDTSDLLPKHYYLYDVDMNQLLLGPLSLYEPLMKLWDYLLIMVVLIYGVITCI